MYFAKEVKLGSVSANKMLLIEMNVQYPLKFDLSLVSVNMEEKIK